VLSCGVFNLANCVVDGWVIIT